MTRLPRDHLRVAFLLGAGASVEAGCPTLDTLSLEFQEGPAKHPDNAVYALLREQLDEWRGKPANDIEVLLEALSDLQSPDEAPLHAFANMADRGPIKELKAEFAQLEASIRRHIRRTVAVDPARLSYLDPLKELTRYFGSLDLFSFNYDFAIEAWCERKDVTYTDGFGSSWQPDLFDVQSFQIRLHKLHGSLLWYRTQEKPRRLIKVPLKLPDHTAASWFAGGTLRDEIVYPKRSKDQHLEPYGTLLARFRQALKSIDLLICVGYSFRDSYIKDLVLEKMYENPRLHLCVVSPDALEMLTWSDERLRGDWKFADFHRRVLWVEAPAGEAFSNNRLLGLVTKVERGIYAAEQISFLRATSADVGTALAEAITSFAEVGDVGRVASIIERVRDTDDLLSALGHVSDPLHRVLMTGISADQKCGSSSFIELTQSSLRKVLQGFAYHPEYPPLHSAWNRASSAEHLGPRRQDLVAMSKRCDELARRCERASLAHAARLVKAAAETLTTGVEILSAPIDVEATRRGVLLSREQPLRARLRKYFHRGEWRPLHTLFST